MTATKELQATLRTHYMEMVRLALESHDEEILITGSNEIAIPCVDAAGNEAFMVISFKIPKGSRDGDAYDGYLAAQDYADKERLKAEKAKEREAAKAKKLAEQEAKRKAKSTKEKETQTEKEAQ